MARETPWALYATHPPDSPSEIIFKFLFAGAIPSGAQLCAWPCALNLSSEPGGAGDETQASSEQSTCLTCCLSLLTGLSLWPFFPPHPPGCIDISLLFTFSMFSGQPPREDTCIVEALSRVWATPSTFGNRQDPQGCTLLLSLSPHTIPVRAEREQLTSQENAELSRSPC